MDNANSERPTRADEFYKSYYKSHSNAEGLAWTEAFFRHLGVDVREIHAAAEKAHLEIEILSRQTGDDK